MPLIDFTQHLNLIDRLEGLISTWLNADWRGARERRGAGGMIVEVVSSATYYNAPTVRVSRASSWAGVDIERLLYRHGVKVWDRGVTSTELYFRVKRRQLRWAEYLLLRAGVPVTSALIEPMNVEWTQGYPPRSEPPNAWPRRR